MARSKPLIPALLYHLAIIPYSNAPPLRLQSYFLLFAGDESMALSLLQPHLPDDKTQSTGWGQLHGCSQSLLIAHTLKQHQGLSVLITEETHSAYKAAEEISFFADQDDKPLTIHVFPDWETLPYDIFSPLEDIVSDRLTTLTALPKMTEGLLIVSIQSLLHRLAPTDFIHAHRLQLHVGDTLAVESFRDKLQRAGYRHVTQVMEHGEYASRGSLLDLFPMGAKQPYRIDLFDNEIETIRIFDPESQRSIDKLDAIELLPAHEFPLTADGIATFKQNYRTQLAGDLSKSAIYSSVREGIAPAGIEYYLPLFFDHTASLFDYLPDNTLILKSANIANSADIFLQTVRDRFEQRRHDNQRPILTPEQLYLDSESVQSALADYPQVTLYDFKQDQNKDCHNYPSVVLPPLRIQAKAEVPLREIRQFLDSQQSKTLFIAESAGRKEELLSLLTDNQYPLKQVDTWQQFIASDAKHCITIAPLEEGLWLGKKSIAIIPEALLIGQQVQQQRRRRKVTRDADAIIRNLTDLSEGSPVVHEEHGVGRFLGMKTIDNGGVPAEYLMLVYAGDDKLYIPVSSLHLISRYTGTSPENAPLHKLGTEQWSKARKKAAQKAHDAAAELLEIHARRAAEIGTSFALNPIEYGHFASSFPFEETPDQLTTIESVINDMQSKQPMDRVVCGDVGFGKTEVAMRATFVAANNCKQVAIIAPTTLLVQQHLQNFRDRFADWPMQIESLSRFCSAKETRETLKKMASGNVDIVIGTHKLLQKDIKFKNLGLVIIDEEHRFGVRHKEQLKKLRASVDMLTLTATPIPRTLNMSLAGLRDLSIIATPPVARHPVKTFINEWDNSIVQEACTRELARGGQVYFLHNEVKSIAKMCKDLQELLPQAKVRFAHGQMRERELESIMEDFHHQRFHILVATTIIESGIDIPNANTIIINRADKLGLAQLHQIRGRVGRSHHRAYAYLITPPMNLLSVDAKKRLEAIESLEDLGVGFTLASHDLEIRGAGELLGEDQSGQIQEIGFTLYNELLDRAVKALKAGELPNIESVGIEKTLVDIASPALIPSDYINDVHQRLILYKRIASAPDKQALRELRVEMIDRFGLLPEVATHLFVINDLKMHAERLGIIKLELRSTGGRIVFSATPKVDIGLLIGEIQKRPWELKLDGQDKLKFEYEEKTKIEHRTQWIKQLFSAIALDD